MWKVILPDDHDLCIRRFLEEIDGLGVNKRKKAVLHVGSHMGEEVPAYLDFSYSPIYLVEANPEVSPALQEKFKSNDRITVFPFAVSDRSGTTEFVIHKTEKGGMESSGLLNLKMLGEIVPSFNSEVRYEVPTITLDSLMEKEALIEKIGLLVIDVQGAEMLVLKGGGNFLKNVDAVICEVNLIQTYEGCPLESEIDEVFKKLGFTKRLGIYHELYDKDGRFPAWGECLWYRKT